MKFLGSIALVLMTTVTWAMPSLDSAEQIAARYLERSSEPYTFNVTAQVTFLRTSPADSWTAIGIADSQGAALLFTETDEVVRQCREIKPGDRLILSGHSITTPNSGSLPIPYITKLHRLEHGTTPTPAEVPLADLTKGSWSFQNIRIRGILRDAVQSETNPRWTMLVISSGPNTLYASMPRDEADVPRIDRLIGSEITTSGIYAPFGATRRERLGPNLAICKSSDLQPASDSPLTPGTEPDLITLDTATGNTFPSLGNHRTVGHVLASWHPRHVLLQTDDGTLVNLELADDQLPAHGQWITAVGLPEVDFFVLCLDHVRWQPAKPKPIAEPPVETIPVSNIIQRANASIQISNQYHGHIIRLTGIVRSIANGQLFLETEDELIRVDGSALETPFSEVSVGCRVEVSGICIMEREERRTNTSFPRLKGFLLVLRTPADIRVITHPSWWTTGRLLTIIGTLLTFLVAIIIWNAVLRQLVNRKSRELFKEQLGHVKAELRTEERTRLAVELHDTLAQNLTGVSMEIEAASDLRGNAPKEMTDHIDIAAKALKSCRDELRNCLWDLRCQALEENDLNQAIRLTLQPHVSDARLLIRFNVPRSKLSDSTTHALLMVIRELTLNAIRHGHASEIRIAGSMDGGRLHCSVTDNGSGFDINTAPGVLQGHFGLKGVAERIEKLDGEFTIQSTPGKGTKAYITL